VPGRGATQGVNFTILLAKLDFPDSRSSPPNQNAMPELLDQDDIDAALKKFPDWEQEKDALVRVVEFEEFMEGVDFVNDLAEIADEAQHHPDILIQYHKVTLTLTTHDAGGITEADLELAQRIDNLLDG
jgi:4a-hydroxytetrahydrobiopterin dehydratase